jgi:hypothetical protein
MGRIWVARCIAALNLVTYLGYVSSGLVAYTLMKRLTKRVDISIFAAYAVAFVPYHIVKSSGHLTNMFNWVFVAMTGLFIAFWRRPSWIGGGALAACMAAAWYTDGYYMLSSVVLLAALATVAVCVDFLSGNTLKSLMLKVLRLGTVGIMVLVLTSPIAIVQVTAGDSVNKDLANSRGNVSQDVINYSAKPLDFLLPPLENPFVSHFSLYKKATVVKNKRSNSSESSNYVGFSVLVLMAGAFLYSIRRLYLVRKEHLVLSIQDYVMTVCLFAVPLMMLWIISPVLYVFGVTIHLPMHYVAEYVPLWRVPSRMFVALQPLTIIVASLMLYRLVNYNRVPSWLRRSLVIIAIIVIACEFYSPVYRPSFNVNRMPQAYHWLSAQQDIRAVAELPLIDRPIEISGYYVFAQTIHNKPIVNTSLSQTPIGLFNPLGTQKNPETINFLKKRGVDAVIIHDKKCSEYEWGRLVYTEKNTLSPQLPTRESTCIYKLLDHNAPDDYFALTQEGFDALSFTNSAGRRGEV